MEERLRKIKWIMLDVDGTLTDGGIQVSNSGEYTKKFHVRDGFGIVEAKKEGLKFAIITGRQTEIIRIRLQEELKIDEVHQGVKNKLEVLGMLKKRHQIATDEILYMGDDVNDLAVLGYVGILACPHNSVQEIIEVSDIKAEAIGGEGAVREIIEKVMKAQGKWENVIKRYRP
ncbi:MAG: HAD hydrolase family protein [Fusobacteria bacterium]|nr:HAD hydrolase family protein [Fusobacteriota bacterium]